MNTVRRGAGRKAHEEKTNRHAQRTPLPPRKGQVNDAREVIAYGKMTRAELLKAAQDMGLSPKSRATMEQIRVEILEKEKADAAERGKTAKAAKAIPPRQKAERPKGTEAPSIPNMDGTKSQAKANAFITAAAGAGWSLGSVSSDGTHTTVAVKRDKEIITIGWRDGVFQYDETTYVYDGRGEVKLRNASAAKQRMAMTPEEASQEAARKRERPTFARSERSGKDGEHTPTRRRQASVNFEQMTDEEVLDAIKGKRITYINSISQSEEVERIPRDDEHRRGSQARAKMHEGPNGRYVSFLGNGGFRSVLISAITKVK